MIRETAALGAILLITFGYCFVEWWINERRN